MIKTPTNLRLLGFDDFVEIILSLALMPRIYALFGRNPQATALDIEREAERGLDIFGAVLDAVIAAPNKPQIEKNLWPMACLAAAIVPRFEIHGEGKLKAASPEVQEHVEAGLRVFQACFDYLRRREKVQ